MSPSGVPVNEPGSSLRTRWSCGRAAMSGCSSHAWLPSLKMGASGSLSACWTTITGTSAAVAASIARPMFARLVEVGGSLIGSAPSKYSFWTSITISARFGIVAPPEIRARSGSHEVAGDEEDGGGPRGEAAHEIRVPLRAERRGDEHLEAALDERELQRRAHPVEHLELEAVAADAHALRERDRLLDQALVVRRDRRV